MIPHPVATPPRPSRRMRIGQWLCALLVAALYLIPFFSLNGAVELYLKIDPIKGESTTKGHVDEIKALSFGWDGSSDSQVGGQTPKDLSALRLVKITDRSSPLLLLNLLTATQIPEATLIATDNETGTYLDFLKLDLEGVQVTSYSISSSEPPVESFDLHFQTFQATYTQFVGNTNVGSTYVFWDLATNTGTGGTGTNLPPTISAINNQVVNEDGSVQVSFTISDPDTPLGALSLGRSSSNPTLLPLANITFGGSGANRTATLTPAPNQNGSTNVGITVSDGASNDTSNFTLTVNPVNDPPVIAPIPSQVTEADTTLFLNVSLSDIDSPINSVTLSGSANPPALITSISDTTGTGSVRSLEIVPAPGAIGMTTITLTATDSASAQSQTTFTLSINPPSGGPTAITLDGNDATVPVLLDENAPNDTELGTLDAVDPPSLTHTFVLLDNAGGRFAIGGPANDRLLVLDGTLLDFESTPSHTVVVEATDTNDPARVRTDSFTIDLQNVNEAPLITLPPDLGTTPPDTDYTLTGITLGDPDAGSADITATFSVTSGILTIDDTGPLAGKVTNNGTASLAVTASLPELNAVLSATGLTYRSDPPFAGTETLGVQVNDNGNSGSGSAQSANANATLEVVLTPWEQWRRDHFTAAELLDLNISGFTADPDDDKLRNGAEYGVNSDPKASSSGPELITLTYVESGGNTYPALTFPRRISDPDLTVELDVATNLQNFASGATVSVEHSAIPIDTDFDQPTIRSLTPRTAEPTQQLRLIFSLTP